MTCSVKQDEFPLQSICINKKSENIIMERKKAIAAIFVVVFYSFL